MKQLVFMTILGFLALNTACKSKGCTDSKAENYNESAKKDDGSCTYADTVNSGVENGGDTSNIMGYGVLSKVPGIWTGPVTSSTGLGDFPIWIVDFRPISGSQVSAKSELNANNDIFMSFFICKIDNRLKVAFRNGGKFAGNVRNSYMIIDSVSEVSTHSFYRFSDPISGGDRVYTDVTFKGDSMIMHTYTNKFSTLSTPVTHMIWRADLRDNSSTQDAINHFGFPKKEMTKDFSTTFDGFSEAVFYNTASDPYPEQDQPYLGVSHVDVVISSPASPDQNKNILIFISTQPLFNGFVFDITKLKYRSRLVYVGATNPAGYDFNYMHPGNYYVNAVYDANGDYNFSSGDYMNSSLDVPFSLSDEGTTSVSVNINFQIP